MMHRLRRYDVLRCAQYDAARFTRNDAMFAPKHQAKPTTLASAASLVKRHHLPKATIIQKTHLCRQTKVRFLLVRITGLEPALRLRNMDLNHTRLPIPPYPLIFKHIINYIKSVLSCQFKINYLKEMLGTVLQKQTQ